MVRSISSRLISVCVLVLLIATAKALRCWQCSSNAVNGSLCRDPFEPELFPRVRDVYTDCNLPTLLDKRPVCKKHELEMYGQKLIRRSCGYADYKDAADKCYYDDVPAYFKTVFCETCSTDGCNAAGELQTLFSARLLAVISLFCYALLL